MGDDAATVTQYRLEGTRVSPKRTTIDTGDAEFEVGRDVNPVEYFLGAIAACLNSTGTMVARDHGIDIESLSIEVEGAVDYAAYLGEATDARPGLRDVTVALSIESDASDEELQAWLDGVKSRCPVTDNVENETGLNVALNTT